MLALGEQLALTQPEGTLNPALHRMLAEHFSDAEILELGLVGGIRPGSPSLCSPMIFEKAGTLALLPLRTPITP